MFQDGEGPAVSQDGVTTFHTAMLENVAPLLACCSSVCFGVKMHFPDPWYKLKMQIYFFIHFEWQFPFIISQDLNSPGPFPSHSLEQSRHLHNGLPICVACTSSPPARGTTSPLPDLMHLSLLFSLLSAVQTPRPHLCSMLLPQGLCTSYALSWNISTSNVQVAFGPLTFLREGLL